MKKDATNNQTQAKAVRLPAAQTAIKNDIIDNKPRWDLIPLECLNDLAIVYTKCAQKYAPNNWKDLDNGYERYKGALLRHLYAAETEDIDADTGCWHLAQVIWNAVALLWFKKYKHGTKATA